MPTNGTQLSLKFYVHNQNKKRKSGDLIGVDLDIIILTSSELEVKLLGDDVPIDKGTSTAGGRGTLLGTMVLLLLSVQSSTPTGQVGTASTTPDRPYNDMWTIGRDTDEREGRGEQMILYTHTITGLTDAWSSHSVRGYNTLLCLVCAYKHMDAYNYRPAFDWGWAYSPAQQCLPAVFPLCTPQNNMSWKLGGF